MQLLYSHQNPMMVHNIVNALDCQGIESQIRNEMIISVMGEGAGFDAWPEVWVADEDLVQATRVLEKALTIVDHNKTWVCPDCGEQNEANFEVCWQCSSQGEP